MDLRHADGTYPRTKQCKLYLWVLINEKMTEISVSIGIITFDERLNRAIIFHVMKNLDFGVILNSLQVVITMGAGVAEMRENIRGSRNHSEEEPNACDDGFGWLP